MKNLITAMACLMILLAFVTQFAQNQVIHYHITAVDQEINQFRDMIKEEGCVTLQNERWLKKRLSHIVQCREDEVHVSGDREPLPRGKPIRYTVSLSIGGLIGIPGFWGIEESENSMDYQIDRYTTSEYDNGSVK